MITVLASSILLFMAAIIGVPDPSSDSKRTSSRMSCFNHLILSSSLVSFPVSKDNCLERVKQKKLHATFRKNFLGGKDHNELMESNDIYRKFDEVRNYRFQIMHKGKRLSMHDAEANLRNILNINLYLIENISQYFELIIQRFGQPLT